MHTTRKVKLKDLSSNLTCNLCGGYYIDATTIIECLHSFCRSCIVQHLEKSEYCPVCDVQLHSSNPLASIRSDQMLQEVVYKLVPGLFQNEMSQRRKFYHMHPESEAKTQQDGGQVFNESYICSDDMIHLSLEFDTTDKKLRDSTRRYILCPAAVSIAILKKLIQGKYDLKNTNSIDIMYGERYLPDDFLLMDIAYKYSWNKNGGGPLQLDYRVRGLPIAHPQFKRNLTRLESAMSGKSSPFSKLWKGQDLTQKSKVFSNSNKIREPLLLKANETPSGRPRGRPKRNSAITTEDSVVEVKKPRLTKPLKTPKSAKPKKSDSHKSVDHEMAQATEVQLRISENGVISAKSVSSGEEKIINPGLSLQMNSNTRSLEGNFPSPIKFASKSPSANGNYNSFKDSPPTEELDSVSAQAPHMSNLKFKTQKQKYSNNTVLNGGKAGNESPDRKLPEKAELKDKPRNPSVSSTLNVPSPNKWAQQSNSLNGNSKLATTKASAMYLAPSSSPSASLPSKKPPKFFKSRISETNGHNHINTDSKAAKADLKPPVSAPNKGSSSLSPPHYENGITEKYLQPFQSVNSGKWPDGIGQPLPTQEQVNQFLRGIMYPFQVQHESSINMNTMGIPMHFGPSATSSYCALPFFPNPNSSPINPFLASALASSMNLNPSFPFSYTNTNPSPNSSNASSGNPKLCKGSGNERNASLDLSLPSKMPKPTSFVSISPKKSQIEQKRQKPEPKPCATSDPLRNTQSSSPNAKEKSSENSPEKLTTKLSENERISPGSNGNGNPESKEPRAATPTENGVDGATQDETEKNKVNGDGALPNLNDSKVAKNNCEPQASVASELKSPSSLKGIGGNGPSPPAIPSNEVPAKTSDSIPTVLATLTVSLDELNDISPPDPPTVSGKSPSTAINNNNILSSSDPQQESVSSSVTFISSSTTSTSSA